MTLNLLTSYFKIKNKHAHLLALKEVLRNEIAKINKMLKINCFNSNSFNIYNYNNNNNSQLRFQQIIK